MALYRWIKTESRWNKNLISQLSPNWSASLQPSLERKATQPDALIGPNDSTATGWKMWCAWVFEYFADLRMAASSTAEPASWAAPATYELANRQMTVTFQLSGFPASQETRERLSGRFPSYRLRQNYYKTRAHHGDEIPERDVTYHLTCLLIYHWTTTHM